jgi:hypothetical protein
MSPDKQTSKYTIHEAKYKLITCGKIPPGPAELLVAATNILVASSAVHWMAGLANSITALGNIG